MYRNKNYLKNFNLKKILLKYFLFFNRLLSKIQALSMFTIIKQNVLEILQIVMILLISLII